MHQQEQSVRQSRTVKENVPGREEKGPHVFKKCHVMLWKRVKLYRKVWSK